MNFKIFVAARHHHDINLVRCKLSSANIPVFVDRNLNEKNEKQHVVMFS